jgi:drug/metabolite transporter (DMT)-like permease
MTDQRPNGEIRVIRRDWGRGDARRPGLPWIGVFLLVFGGLLLLERLLPEFRAAGSAFLLALGLVFLVRWLLERSAGSLYAGALISGLAAPGVLSGLGIARGPGIGTLCLGLAFLFIAFARRRGRRLGWQAWLGAVLVVMGLTTAVVPQIGPFVLPALLVVFGLLLVLGGSTPARRWSR